MDFSDPDFTEEFNQLLNGKLSPILPNHFKKWDKRNTS